MTLRKFFFWLHLVAGTVAGIVIFIMSVTGVVLAYQREISDFVDRGFRVQRSVGVSSHLPAGVLLTKTTESQGKVPTAFTLRSDESAPAEAAYGRERSIY